MTAAGVRLAILSVVAALAQTSNACQSCKTMSKDERAMFRAHSDACLEESRAAPALVEGLFRGELVEDTKLKRHVYCMLLKCKMISKDGKLQKAAALGGLPAAGASAARAAEACAGAGAAAATPEDAAWSVFKCGYDRKSILFDSGRSDAPSPGAAANNTAVQSGNDEPPKEAIGKPWKLPRIQASEESSDSGSKAPTPHN